MIYELQTYATEAEAILAAVQSAREFAMKYDDEAEENVLLEDGNTLFIECTSKGKITDILCGGWNFAGHVFCSVKLLKKIQRRMSNEA
jgi:hypothetical protein